MIEDANSLSCGAAPPSPAFSGVALPVLPLRDQGVRRSRMSRWRGFTLAAIHLLFIGHMVHWAVAGRTLSPVEPSESMFTLNEGHLNAGFIFFAAALLATLVLGRFVCGWGCHFIAYQDLCNWGLKKIGIRPKPLRSRILVLAPLALALYMFVWPTVYRVFSGIPWPTLSNHLMKSAFWETFPGPGVAILTIVIGGFGLVYFLGAKGFCTYGCPYGGFFALADKVAPGRIRVTDACAQCGHCTAACTSNVVVHEEVAKFGMVVDPGCMKCLDCVSVCPNDALYFGFAKPALGVKPKAPRRRIRYDFSLGEELLMVAIGLGTLLALRGLYSRIPLLLSMALGGATAYAVMKAIRLARDPHVRLQNLNLKRGGRLTRAGLIFVSLTAGWCVFTAHSAAVQYHAWRGRALFASLALPDGVWFSGDDWRERASAQRLGELGAAIEHLEWADQWGLGSTLEVLEELVWLYLADRRVDDAERTTRRLVRLMPQRPDPHRGLGSVLRKRGLLVDAEGQFRRALEIQPAYVPGRNELCAMLMSSGRHEEAIAAFREGMEVSPDSPHWPIGLGRLLMNMGRLGEAAEILDRLLKEMPQCAEGHGLRGALALQMGHAEAGLGHLRRVVELEEPSAQAHYNLGMALLSLRKTEKAIEHLQAAIEINPDSALAHYNLGVAMYMAGKPAESIRHVQESIRLTPHDPVSQAFLAVVLRELGDLPGAAEATAKAERLRRGR